MTTDTERFLPMRKYFKIMCVNPFTVRTARFNAKRKKKLHILTILTTAVPSFFYYICNLLIIIENTVFSARYEMNLCIEGFHQRLPDSAMAQAVGTRCLTSKNPGSRLGQSLWNFWRTKWAWDNSVSEYFGFPLSVSRHKCSGLTNQLTN